MRWPDKTMDEGVKTSTRSLVLVAGAAATGLLIAGFGLFTAKGTASRTVPPEDIALVNQRPILRTDFIAQTETLYGQPFGRTTPKQRRQVVADMLREELFVQRGLELDLAASDPDVRQALVTGVERQVEADVTAQAPSDTQLRRYYAEHRDDYASEGEMTVIDLAAKGAKSTDSSRLQAAVAALRRGGPVSETAARFGLVETNRTKGEEFYFAARIHLGPRLFELARRLKPGAIAGPVDEDGAPHILVMVKSSPPEPMSFEDARGRVQQDYAKTERRRIEAADEAYLRRKADLLLAPDIR